MTRSHRNEDRGGEHRWTFNGVEYPTRKLMCEARRAEYVRLLDEEGMNFTQAAHAVAEELNDRPRKTLGFMKPSEKIIELLDAA